MDLTAAVVSGVVIGILLAAIFSAWLYIHLTRGWDRKNREGAPIYGDELRKHLGEVRIP